MKYVLIVALYICSARNIVGQYFSAQSDNQVVAQDEALKTCQKLSVLFCYATGCDKAAERGETK